MSRKFTIILGSFFEKLASICRVFLKNHVKVIAVLLWLLLFVPTANLNAQCNTPAITLESGSCATSILLKASEGYGTYRWYLDGTEIYAETDSLINTNPYGNGDYKVVGTGGACAPSDTSAIYTLLCEICDNGIDDDGDTFIDCADPDCINYGGCLDCDSDGVSDTLDLCICDPLLLGSLNGYGCGFPDSCAYTIVDTITFDTSGVNYTAGFVTIYIMTDSVGEIVDTSYTPSFSSLSVGKFMIVAINFEDDASITNLAIGNDLNTVTANCFDLSNALTYKVCPEEDCGNGIDDDDDGLVDCDDPDCAPIALITASSSNECPNDFIAFSATDAGVGSTYSWNFGPAASPATATGIGPHNVAYSICGNKEVILDVSKNGCTVSDTIWVDIIDAIAPTFAAPSDVTLNCEEDIDNLTLTGNVSVVSDNCSVQDTTYSDDTSAQTGCNNTGTVIRTWTVQDNCANTTTLSQTISIVDNAAPTADALAALGSFTCHADVPVPDIFLVQNEVDDCSATVVVSFVSDNVLPGCSTNIVRTYRLTDDCGNQRDITQSIAVDMPNINAGTLSIDNTIPCLLSTSEGTISATPDGSAVIPCDHTLLYILTEGASNTILDTSSNPIFTFTAIGNYTIHTLIYNAVPSDINFLDLSTITFGATPLSTLNATLNQGGGNICAVLDLTGAEATPINCGGSIGDRVWLDINEDGIQDIDEKGLSGIAVNIYNTSSVLIASTITQSGGYYKFKNLPEGTYRLKFYPQNGYNVTYKNWASDANLDSDIDFLNETAIINLAENQILDNIDAGFYACSNVAYNAVITSNKSNEIHFLDYFNQQEEDDLIGIVKDPEDVKLGPDGYLYIADNKNDQIQVVDKTSRSLVFTISNPALNGPTGLVFGPDGFLYVSNKKNNNILRFDISTDLLYDIYLNAGDGLTSPGLGIEFDSDGNLYFVNDMTTIKKYDPLTGSLSDFITISSNLSYEIGDFIITTGNHFLLTRKKLNKVEEYDANGNFLIDFVVADAGGLNGPCGLTWGPDNHLYVVSSRNDVIKRYNGTNGLFINDIYSGNGMDDGRAICFFPDNDCCVVAPVTGDSLFSVETMPTGSYIINMGIMPQTIDNSLKPYGLVFELVDNYMATVKWAIDSTKTKDGIDFSYNGTDYKGGTFIIPGDVINSEIDSVINIWEAQGVVGEKTTIPISVQIRTTINHSVHWTLDQDNGAIAETYLQAAGIPSVAYDWVLPDSLDCCNDIFVLPHAEPGWDTHKGLYYWNAPNCDGGCGGAIWIGCRAGSYVENAINPMDSSLRLNFLMEDPVFPETNPTVPHDIHADGVPPFTYAYPTHPVMQFMGILDDATTGGSEQIYLPTNAWRPTTKIPVWDPLHTDIPALSSGKAAVLAFGPAFGDSNRGLVALTGGHNLNGTAPENVAAIRSFFNFSFYTAAFKALELTVSVPDTMKLGQSYQVSALGTGGSGSITYQWQSDCSGSFLDPTASTTTFTPDFVYQQTPCVITCVISDDCQVRNTFIPTATIIEPVVLPPVAVDDFESTVMDTPAAVDVVYNDYDLNLDLDTTSVSNNGLLSPSNGSIIIDPVTGVITYTPDNGFTGIDSFEYSICDLTALCDTAMVLININCLGTLNQNLIEGTVFEDLNMDGLLTAGETGVDNLKIRIYEDLNQNGVIDGLESAIDSILTTPDGSYSIAVSPVFFSNESIDSRIIQSSDDAAEEDDGTMKSLSSSDIKFKNTSMSNPLYNGFRFQNINIPEGSIITNAYIEFTSQSDKSGSNLTTFYGEKVVNSQSFVQMDNNISGRLMTTSTIDWSIPDTETDTIYQTPDISTIVQEIVDLPLWNSGNNSITIIGECPNSSERKFKSYNHTAQEAPRLVIEYQKLVAIVTQYIVELDSTTIPSNALLTTDILETASFIFTSQTDCNNDFGYSFPNNIIVGNFVWEDLNGNGVQDSGEPGIDSVEVTFSGMTATSIAVSIKDTTDINGVYSFNNVFPGDYTLTFTTPNGYFFTYKDLGGNDGLDSDPDTITGITDTLFATSGNVYLDMDAGMVRLATIADWAFLDCNQNGLQDLGESGIENVPVALSGTDGAGNPVALNDTTDVNGNYDFATLRPGTYSLIFGMPPSPTGLGYTAANIGANDTIDSDVNAISGQTALITVISNQLNFITDAGFIDITAPVFTTLAS
ncbi:MAG: hypothetical protein ACI8VT_000960, partial [Saprospiraceae bacterium]